MENEAGRDASPLLRVRDLFVRYGSIAAVKGVSIDIYRGEFVTLIGSNGAGKSTVLRAISGLLREVTGQIEFGNTNIRAIGPARIVKAGVVHCPEGRRIFSRLSVEENLLLGFYTSGSTDRASALERIYSMFPILKDKRNALGHTLSGGQQQMLAIGRSLMIKPPLLMLDEPSLGLAPLVIQQIFEIISDINKSGTAIFLVEQNANLALRLADRAYVLESGNIVLSGKAGDLLSSDLVRKAYLGEL